MTATENRLRKSAFSRISFEQNIVLQHHVSQRIHKRFYARLDHALFVSTKILRAQRRNEEASQIETAARNLCDAMQANLTQAAAQFAATSRSAHVTEVAGISDKAISQSAEFSTSFSLRVLDLFHRFDQLLIQIESLELHNVCSPEECSRVIHFWNGEFRHFLAALISLRNSNQPKETQHE